MSSWSLSRSTHTHAYFEYSFLYRYGHTSFFWPINHAIYDESHRDLEIRQYIAFEYKSGPISIYWIINGSQRSSIINPMWCEHQQMWRAYYIILVSSCIRHNERPLSLRECIILVRVSVRKIGVGGADITYILYYTRVCVLDSWYWPDWPSCMILLYLCAL